MERPQAIPLGKINGALIFLMKVTVQLKKLNAQHTLKTAKKCNNKLKNNTHSLVTLHSGSMSLMTL